MSKPNETVDHHSPPTLCWDCARACGDGNCEWADSLQPISGWIISSTPGSVSHSVLYCPKFIKGRTGAELTDEQFDNEHTNDMNVLGVTNVFCRPGSVSGYTQRLVCPICSTQFGVKTPLCPHCGISLLWYSFN